MEPVEEALQQAILLCQNGEKQQAAKLLVSLIKQVSTSEQAWWMLAACLENPAQQRDCLERVLSINPGHLGAKLFIDRLDKSIPLPDPCQVDSLNLPIQAGDGYAETTPFHEPALPEQEDPQITHLAATALEAEERKEFLLAISLYSRILEIDSSHITAWLRKGYCSARLSDAENNHFAEFFDCLSRAVLARDPFGLALNEALTRLEPVFARAASDRLLRLASYAAQLALSTPQPMANVYAVERVHLTDWAYSIGRKLGTFTGLWCSRAELIAVAYDAYQRIVQSVLENQRSARTRRDTIHRLRAFLLTNLETSGIYQDPEFLQGLAQITDEALK